MKRPKIGVAIRREWPLSEISRVAKMADRLGFNQVWFNSMPLSPDPFLVLNQVAKVTSQIHLGTAIIDAYSRNPASLVPLP